VPAATPTAENYLRALLELEEEGVIPLRARLGERLGHRAPTVSGTVARLERDGLLRLTTGRRIELTEEGRRVATRVLRRRRLAECLLIEVIGIGHEEAHREAARWEHILTETVERRLLPLLRDPRTSPDGTPIPGLDELAPTAHQ
jgi:DtxR family Mn-dependent transcriptional regulator